LHLNCVFCISKPQPNDRSSFSAIAFPLFATASALFNESILCF
jgi:hypothetical protein